MELATGVKPSVEARENKVIYVLNRFHAFYFTKNLHLLQYLFLIIFFIMKFIGISLDCSGEFR